MSDENTTINPEDIEPLNTPTLKITYDRRNQVLIISYHKELNAENTLLMYKWLFSSIEKRGMGGIRGAVYDFTDVQKFTTSNLISTQRGSMAINAKADLSRMPVAMLVKTVMQEQQVGIVMNITPGEQRKRIVKSMSQALTFISDFHKNLAQSEG